MARIHAELAGTEDGELVASPLADLSGEFGELPLFREHCLEKKKKLPSGKLTSRKGFESFLKKQQALFAPSDAQGKPNPKYPPVEHLEEVQRESEEQMMGANSFISGCCCLCIPLGKKGRELAIDASNYVRESALSPDYAYSNSRLRLFLNCPSKLPTSGGLACVLFVRGGGFATTAASWQFVARKIARSLKAVVINVDTRLPKAATGPGQALDLLAALNWVHEQLALPEESRLSELRNVDSKRVSVLGNSGGCFPCIGLALELAKRGESNKVKGLLLQVPLIFPRWTLEPVDQMLPYNRRFWAEEVFRGMWSCYACPEESNKRNLANQTPESLWADRDNRPDLFALGSTAGSLLPKAPAMSILTTEFDFGRWQTDEFAKMVKDAGKLNDYVVMVGRSHTDANPFDKECETITKQMFEMYLS